LLTSNFINLQLKVMQQRGSSSPRSPGSLSVAAEVKKIFAVHHAQTFVSISFKRTCYIWWSIPIYILKIRCLSSAHLCMLWNWGSLAEIPRCIDR